MKHYEGADEKLKPIIEEFETQINSFVYNLFENSTAKTADVAAKVINDPVWGSISFYGYEIKILDSPILQRLRDISQVGMASLTYPSARHSRFEHSLGVFHTASEMIKNINSRNDGNCINNRENKMIRLAALLHDIGHCFSSHLSERIYGNLEQMHQIKTHPLFIKAKPHEIFAYFIINSPCFMDFFEKLNCGLDNIDHGFFDSIGRMVVGYPVEEVDQKTKKTVYKHFMTNIINGDFDADKLDYIRRDTYFGGLFLNYDIERFLYRIDINSETTDGALHKYLIISLTGVTAIEEMAFSRIMLTSYIYFHQKVLAADAFMSDFGLSLINDDIITHPCEFLYYTDSKLKLASFLNNYISSETRRTYGEILRNLENRTLPKRALVIKTMYIDKDTAKETEYDLDYKAFIGEVENLAKKSPKLKEAYLKVKNRIELTIKEKPVDLTELVNTERGNIREQIKTTDKVREGIYTTAQEIYKRVRRSNKHTLENTSFDKYDIYVSFREEPSFSSEDINIIDYNNTPLTLNDVMPLEPWTKAFAANKWSGYIFSRVDLVPLINVAAREYFKRQYKIVFLEDFKFAYLKAEEIQRAIDIERIISQMN